MCGPYIIGHSMEASMELHGGYTVPVQFVAKVSRIILMRDVEGSFSFLPPGVVHR